MKQDLEKSGIYVNKGSTNSELPQHQLLRRLLWWLNVVWNNLFNGHGEPWFPFCVSPLCVHLKGFLSGFPWHPPWGFPLSCPEHEAAPFGDQRGRKTPPKQTESWRGSRPEASRRELCSSNHLFLPCVNNHDIILLLLLVDNSLLPFGSSLGL